MSFVPTVLALLIASQAVAEGSRTFSCHGHSMSVTPVGVEHVNHRVVLNGRDRVVELENAMWFIESVSCAPDGFKIIASHIQYNEPTKREFTLTVDGERYEIK